MKSTIRTSAPGVRRFSTNLSCLARAALVAATIQMLCLAVCANTLLWYRFDGDGATIENKADPGTMDGALKSINSWGSLGGLGDTTAKFPTRGDAFPEGNALIDLATDTVHPETVKSLTFSGDPANSGTVRLLKADTTTAFKEMMSFTCEVFFKLPGDSAAIETRRAKDILFPLVDWGSPDGNGYGWFFGLRKDSSSTGFYPFFRSKHHNGSGAVQNDCQDKTYLNDDKWHHLAVVVTADASANTATVKLVLDYTTLATTKALSGFRGFHYNNNGNFPLLVGADLWRSSNGSKNCCFMGEIAEVRISDVALAADELLRPLPDGPVDDATLVYLPMGDCDWFGSPNTASYKNIYHGVLNAARTAACTPYWTSDTTSAAYPASAADAAGASVRDGYFAAAAFADAKSTTFSRALVSGQYAGHVLRVPYEDAHLANGSFTMEWFFKTDGQVPSGNGINSYTFLNCSFAKIMINQANGLLLTRLLPAQGNYQDFNSAVRVDDGQWHHYALVYDADQSAFAAYLDYGKIASQTYALTTGTSTEFYFGGQNPTTQAFSGNLDDFRITKRALNAGEFLTTRQLVTDNSLFAHFDNDLSTGQDAVYAPEGVGGTLGGGSAPSYVNRPLRIDLDGDERPEIQTATALHLDGGSVVFPHNSLLESSDFTVEWFAKYASLANNTMLLRFGMQNNEGTGTICWALYRQTGKLRLGTNVSPDGTWHNLHREDQDFATGANADIDDGRWHHWALVAETHPDASVANTSFTLYRDYEPFGNVLVFDGAGDAGGMIALPSTGTTLSIGTGGSAIDGIVDELRFRPGAQPVSSFMRRLNHPFVLVVR